MSSNMNSGPVGLQMHVWYNLEVYLNEHVEFELLEKTLQEEAEVVRVILNIEPVEPKRPILELLVIAWATFWFPYFS